MDSIGRDWEKYQKQYDQHNQQVDFKILDRKENENERVTIQYSRSKMGALASDRELCIRVVTKKDPITGKQLSIISNEDHPDCPQNTGAVRMDFFCASQIEQKGNDLHMTEF